MNGRDGDHVLCRLQRINEQHMTISDLFPFPISLYDVIGNGAAWSRIMNTRNGICSLYTIKFTMFPCVNIIVLDFTGFV